MLEKEVRDLTLSNKLLKEEIMQLKAGASSQVSIVRRVGSEDRRELAQPLKTTSQGAGTLRDATEQQHSDSEDGYWEAE